MHLTNYAINKNSNKFVENDDADSNGSQGDSDAHKRSLKSLWNMLQQMGHNVPQLLKQIDDIIIKTIIVAQPTLAHIQKSCNPDDVENQLCF